MEIIFIRHGHGEHLENYPNGLNILHPSLTEYGKNQTKQLKRNIKIDLGSLVLVSPTKRTIETAKILTGNMNFIISPLIGPRMFPQNVGYSTLRCDQILTKAEISNLYGVVEVVDFDYECWNDGINKIDQTIFEEYATRLLNWVKERYNKVYIISHDGTITNYRILLGEKELTRKDFLGEAGVYKLTTT